MDRFLGLTPQALCERVLRTLFDLSIQKLGLNFPETIYEKDTLRDT